jgi:hypothetical protein
MLNSVKNRVPMRPHLHFRSLAATAAVLSTLAVAQVEPAGQLTVTAPVSYASLSQVNGLLAPLEQASQATLLDLAKLRIERWKTDSGSKREAQGNVDSVSRNLQDALPGIMGELRAAPDSLVSTFKLYRNLDALYDVLGAVAESAGAFGSKDEFQSLTNDLTTFENSRRAFADRMETLAGAKEVELTRLRSQQRSAQVVTAPNAPKKVVVDDNEPPKKPVKKATAKPVAKPVAKPSPATSQAATPSQ